VTPGAYIRGQRVAAGMSIDDVALCLETVPYRVAAHVRAEWLAAIEDGVVEVGISTAVALADIPALAIDLDNLAGLAAGPMTIRFIAAPTLREQS
jgi:hypothetical protein